MVYTLTLNPSLDYLMWAEDINTGKTNRSFNEAIQFGGKGINVSYVLNELAVENIALGFIAGFTGEHFKKLINDCGIKSDFIMCKNGHTRINVKIKSDIETEINASGPTISNNDLQILFNKINTLSKGDILVISGSLPKGVSLDIYNIIAKRASENGADIVADITGKSLLEILKYKPILIKPNIDELCEIFGEINTEQDIIKCAQILRNKGAKNVLVSLGKNGAILLSNENKIYKSLALGGKPVNTVGAGDSMVAGFIAGISNSYSYALKLASACGGATAISEGLAKKDLIDKLIY